MIHKVAMPRFGQTMEEGTIERWAKQVGDPVEIGDVLLEITTDKATLEVEAFVSGVLRKVLAEEGEVVKCGRVIALVGDPDEELPEIQPDEVVESAAPAAAESAEAPSPAPAASAPSPAAPATSAAPAPAASPAPAAPAALAPSPAALTVKDRLFASPRAKHRAKIEKVPIGILRGSGPNGRVVEADVLDYAAQLAECKTTPLAREIAFQRGVDLLTVRGSGPNGRIIKDDVIDAPPALPAYDLVEPVSAMRRVVAQRMFESKRDIPHFYLMIEMDMTECVAYRAELNAPGDVRVSYNDLLMKACAIAFREHPGMLAVWGGDRIVTKTQINIGVAVAIDDGLLVPVVKDVDRKSLKEIAVESAALIKKARSKKLTPDEYEDGRLTLSNLGMMDIDCFVPIVNPGEASIMGIGRIKEKAVVIDGGIRVRSMMTVTLSADHRVVDGATAAAFLKRVKDLMEAPREIS